MCYSLHYITIVNVNYVIFRYDHSINRYRHFFLISMYDSISADKPEYMIPLPLIHQKVVRQQTSVSISSCLNRASTWPVSIITNSCTHSSILTKNTLKARVKFTPTCFGSQMEPSSGGQQLILATLYKRFNGASQYSQYCGGIRKPMCAYAHIGFLMQPQYWLYGLAPMNRLYTLASISCWPPEDGSICDPKHVGINFTRAFNVFLINMELWVHELVIIEICVHVYYMSVFIQEQCGIFIFRHIT